MKKLSVLLFVLFCFFSYNVNAQIFGGATVGLQAPMGDFGDGAKWASGSILPVNTCSAKTWLLD